MPHWTRREGSPYPLGVTPMPAEDNLTALMDMPGLWVERMQVAEPYVAVFAVSNNRQRVHDLASFRRTLGFEPLDDAEKNG